MFFWGRERGRAVRRETRVGNVNICLQRRRRREEELCSSTFPEFRTVQRGKEKRGSSSRQKGGNGRRRCWAGKGVIREVGGGKTVSGNFVNRVRLSSYVCPTPCSPRQEGSGADRISSGGANSPSSSSSTSHFPKFFHVSQSVKKKRGKGGRR